MARRDRQTPSRRPDAAGQGGWSTVKVVLVVVVSLAVVAGGVASGVALTGRDSDGDGVAASAESTQPTETAQPLPTEPVATTPTEPAATTAAPVPTTSAVPATTQPEQDEGASVEEPEVGSGGEPQEPEDGHESGAEDEPQGLEPETEDEPKEETVEAPEEGGEGGEAEEGQEPDTEGKPEEKTVKDPEGGSEGGDAEGEPQRPEESEETDIPDSVMPNQAWLDYEADISAFLEDCGWWDRDRGGYGQCENPDDTQTATQMSSDFYGCQFDEESSRCEGYSHWEFRELDDKLACGEGLHLSPKYSSEGEYQGFWCFHPNHPDYESQY